MQKISRIASGAPWEPIFGYSRAVRAGDWVAVSGTTSFDERGLVVGPGQMYVQARQAIGNIAAALERSGARLADVVRTRVFVTDITRFSEVARAHQERFPPETANCLMFASACFTWRSVSSRDPEQSITSLARRRFSSAGI